MTANLNQSHISHGCKDYDFVYRHRRNFLSLQTQISLERILIYHLLERTVTFVNFFVTVHHFAEENNLITKYVKKRITNYVNIANALLFCNLFIY